MADAVDADHERPLRFGDALEEAVGAPAERGEDGEEEEDVDRDEDGVEAIPVDADEPVLHGQDQEEGGRKRPVIGGGRAGEGQEFSQRGEGQDGEEDDDPGAPGKEGQRQKGDDGPPGGDAGIQVLDHLVRAVGGEAGAQDLADRRGDQKDGEDAEKEPGEVRGRHGAPSRRDRSAAEARARKASFVSSGRIRRGGPKVTVQMRGIGTTSLSASRG